MIIHYYIHVVFIMKKKGKLSMNKGNIESMMIEGKVRKEFEINELKSKIGEQVIIHGMIYKLRIMSDFAFVILRRKRDMIQCIYQPEYCDFPIKELKENSSVIIKGIIKEDERSKIGFEINIKEINLLSEPVEEPPVVINNKKIDASLDTILDYRVVTLRNEKERAVFKIQEGILCGAREFLRMNQFTEIYTPKIVFAGAEGGANVFGLDYFGEKAYLAQSPQFYKQMMVGVYERVYEIGKVYRAEKHDTNRHLNEYIGLDLEIGFIEDFAEIMEVETKMLKYILEYLNNNYEMELTLLNVELPVIESIPQVKFSDGKELVAKTYNREMKSPDDLEPMEERLLSEIIKKETDSDFVFVTHYPSSGRPFYAMEDEIDTNYTLSFDLLYKGLEITTGGQRIHKYKDQVAKMIERNMNPEEFNSYLMLHKYGVPPHGGLGMGIERLTMCLLNKTNVRETSMFPRDMKRLEP